MQITTSIQSRIDEIRGERAKPARPAGGPDFDLAALHETKTRVFNEAVKRNIKRFPKDFMFQLTRQEWAGIAIMRAFVEVRRILIQQSDLKEQLKALKERVGGHDVQLNQI